MARSTGQKICLSVLSAIFLPRAKSSGNLILANFGLGQDNDLSALKRLFWPVDLARVQPGGTQYQILPDHTRPPDLTGPSQTLPDPT